MAKDTPTPSPAAGTTPKAEKMITVTLRENYGRRIVGARIEVEEREYNRLRLSDGQGGFTYPVMISDADAAAEDKARADAEKARNAERAARDTDRATSDGWAKYQQKSMQMVAARRQAEELERQRIATGLAKPDQAEVDRQYRERVAGSRAG